MRRDFNKTGGWTLSIYMERENKAIYMKIYTNLYVEQEPGVGGNCNKNRFSNNGFGIKNEISLISSYNKGV